MADGTDGWTVLLTTTIDSSLCVWAAGTGPRELTKALVAAIPEQAASKPGSRGRLAVDPYMRVKVRGGRGMNDGSIESSWHTGVC